jgi:hypothetical protein
MGGLGGAWISLQDRVRGFGYVKDVAVAFGMIGTGFDYN